ncbi:hypothetical protein Ancab_033830 [Ancistrocladus abbreviatus]
MESFKLYLILSRLTMSSRLLLLQPAARHSPEALMVDSNSIEQRRWYRTSRQGKSSSLYSKISPLGSPDISVKPELDDWMEKCKKVNVAELQRIIHDLRKRKRFSQALQVSEWMNERGICQFSPVEHAKMKEMGFTSSALTYNDIMCLYTNTNQYEKVPEVLAEMKENRVLPDNYSYRICINSHGVRSDLNGMEKILKEMETQTHIAMDWNTYAVAANFYIKAGLVDKAIDALKKAEVRVDKKDGTSYNFLISLYAKLGKKDEILNLWELEKGACNRCINRDYINVLESLVRLGELEEAEKLLKEWDLSDNCYDFRVPNILIMGYCEKGLFEKAEAVLVELKGKGKASTSSSWGTVARGYVAMGKMMKAVDTMKAALLLHWENKGWKPNNGVIASLLNWLSENGSVEDTEAFVESLRTVIPVSREMYHALIKVNIRSGKDVNGLLQKMKVEKIDEDEETRKILGMT